MKNKFWVFGDSFSAYNYQDEGNEWLKTMEEVDPDFDYMWWFDIVALMFDLEISCHGVGGNSSPQIIFDVIRNLHKIKEGDYISIGLSDTGREYMTRQMGHELGVIDLPDKTEEHHHHPLVSRGLLSKDDRVKSNDNSHLLKVWDEFLVNFRFDEENDLLNYYKDIGVLLKEHLNKINVKTIVWDRRMWGKHENYFTYTDNKIKDGHWSPNGNISFARYVAKEFKSN